MEGAGPLPEVINAGRTVAGLFDGLELLEPGLVSTSQWRPGAGAGPLNAWAGVARKT